MPITDNEERKRMVQAIYELGLVIASFPPPQALLGMSEDDYAKHIGKLGRPFANLLAVFSEAGMITTGVNTSELRRAVLAPIIGELDSRITALKAFAPSRREDRDGTQRLMASVRISSLEEVIAYLAREAKR